MRTPFTSSSDRRLYWHNLRTGAADLREAPETDAEALDYLPQHEAARGLYEVRRLQEDSVLEAMTVVLEACVAAHGGPAR